MKDSGKVNNCDTIAKIIIITDLAMHTCDYTNKIFASFFFFNQIERYAEKKCENSLTHLSKNLSCNSFTLQRRMQYRNYHETDCTVVVVMSLYFTNDL